MYNVGIKIIALIALINGVLLFGRYKAIDERSDKVYKMLISYERYVRGYEDKKYGYRLMIGYPMYLYGFGTMYYYLYKIDKKIEYKIRFLRCIKIAKDIKTKNWLWQFYNGSRFTKQTPTLYNIMFYELWRDAYLLLGKSRYKQYAINSINGLKNLFMKGGFDKLPGVYNYNFFSFVNIADMLYNFHTGDFEIAVVAYKAIEYAISGYDKKSYKWYYKKSDKLLGSYDSHSAFYQMDELLWFLINYKSIKITFPSFFKIIDNSIHNQFNLIKDYISDRATFYYNSDIEDYTESAANLILFLELYDIVYKKDNTNLIDRAIKTLISRQLKNGNFYKDGKGREAELYYSDNIGWALSRFLYFYKVWKWRYRGGGVRNYY